MRKLILQSHISLDGFIADPAGKTDWILLGAAPEYALNLADRCDTILMGRIMSEGFLGYWESMFDNPPNGVPVPMAERMVKMRKIIFSRTLKEIKARNAEVANGDLVDTVNALKNEPGKELIVYGGANFSSQLIAAGLVDEYHLLINPAALGKGLPIFTDRRTFHLTESLTFKNGVVANTYIPK
ncbi:dihydrofolate reductase family protein [Chitinophaga sp. NPDC101104]|uniref:dihydrofolate reductase family protein n=1 Tax=Chitinophaga sp. NPDC101104 TaxID=3390561 RepID=UPI003D068981